MLVFVFILYNSSEFRKDVLFGVCIIETTSLYTECKNKSWLGGKNLDPREQFSVKFETKYNSFHARKYVWKCHLQNDGHVLSASMC